MCVLDLNPTSTHFLATLIGRKKKKINQEADTVDDQPKNVGDLTKASNVENIIYPTTLNQLPEALHKEVEAKNATNVALALAACPSRLVRAR